MGARLDGRHPFRTSTSGETRFRVGKTAESGLRYRRFSTSSSVTDKSKSQIVGGTSEVSANMQVFGSLPQIFHLADYRMRNRCIHTAE